MYEFYFIFMRISFTMLQYFKSCIVTLSHRNNNYGLKWKSPLRVLSIDMIHKNEVVIREVVINSKGCFMNSFEDRAHKASTSNWITSSINK